MPAHGPPPSHGGGRGYWLISAAGGVFGLGGAPLWGAHLDPDDPAVGLVDRPGGYSIVRRSGRVQHRGPARAPGPADLGGQVIRVRRLDGEWWALRDDAVAVGVRHDEAPEVAVSPGSVDLVGGDDGSTPTGVIDDDTVPGGLIGVVTAGAGGWWLVGGSGAIVHCGAAPALDTMELAESGGPLRGVGAGAAGGLLAVTATGQVHTRLCPHGGGLPRAPSSGPVVAVTARR